MNRKSRNLRLIRARNAALKLQDSFQEAGISSLRKGLQRPSTFPNKLYHLNYKEIELRLLNSYMSTHSRSKLKQIGDWQYNERTYDIYGRNNFQTELEVLHKKEHWVGPTHLDKGKCRCGAEIPGIILMHRAFLRSGWKE